MYVPIKAGFSENVKLHLYIMCKDVHTDVEVLNVNF